MSWSQTIQTENLHDQMTILIGSAIRLLCGEAGVFVVSNAAFDPQSSAEYTPYRLSEAAVSLLLASVEEGIQANAARPFIVAPAPPVLITQYLLDQESVEEAGE